MLASLKESRYINFIPHAGSAVLIVKSRSGGCRGNYVPAEV